MSEGGTQATFTINFVILDEERKSDEEVSDKDSLSEKTDDDGNSSHENEDSFDPETLWLKRAEEQRIRLNKLVDEALSLQFSVEE